MNRQWYNAFCELNLPSIRANSRFEPSQWGMSLQSNAVSHWLGANIESALILASMSVCLPTADPGIILCMHPANERRRYNVMSSLIGWVPAQNDPCDLSDWTLKYTIWSLIWNHFKHTTKNAWMRWLVQRFSLIFHLIIYQRHIYIYLFIYTLHRSKRFIDSL